MFAACNNCNLQLKAVHGKRKRKNNKDSNLKKFRQMSTKERGKKEYDGNYFFPLIFQYLTLYDAHFVIKHFRKKYTECVDKDDRVTYGDVRVTTINSEKCMTFEIGKLQFLDSFQFLLSSLEISCPCCLRAINVISKRRVNIWESERRARIRKGRLPVFVHDIVQKVRRNPMRLFGEIGGATLEGAGSKH